MASGPILLWRVRNTFLEFSVPGETCDHFAGNHGRHASTRSLSADRITGSHGWRIFPLDLRGGAPTNSPSDKTCAKSRGKRNEDTQHHTGSLQESASQADGQQAPGFSLCSIPKVLAQPTNSGVVGNTRSPNVRVSEVSGLPCPPSLTQAPLKTKSWAKVRTSKKSKQDPIPKHLPAGDITAPPSSESLATTMLFRNIACGYSEQDVVKILDEEGFKCTYNCVLLPLNFGGNANLGYVFVNFTMPEHAEACKAWFQGKVFGPRKTAKICDVHAAHRQGLAAFKPLSRKCSSRPLFLNV